VIGLRPRSLGEILDAALTLALRGAAPSLRAVALVMTPFVLLDVLVRSRLAQTDLAGWGVVEHLGILALAAFLALVVLDIMRAIADGRSVSTPLAFRRALWDWPPALAATFLFLGSVFALDRSFFAWVNSGSGGQPATGVHLALGVAILAGMLAPMILVWILANYAWAWTLSDLADSEKPSAFSGLRAIVRKPRRRVLSELAFTLGILLAGLFVEDAFTPTRWLAERPLATLLAGSIYETFMRTMIGLYFLAFVFLSRRDAAIRTEGLDLDVELARLEAAS
jgi:hypothetical protein